MESCKHCGKPIMEFSFEEGKQWWHMPNAGSNTTNRYCNVAGGPTAEPRLTQEVSAA